MNNLKKMETDLSEKYGFANQNKKKMRSIQISKSNPNRNCLSNHEKSRIGSSFQIQNVPVNESEDFRTTIACGELDFDLYR